MGTFPWMAGAWGECQDRYRVGRVTQSRALQRPRQPRGGGRLQGRSARPSPLSSPRPRERERGFSSSNKTGPPGPSRSRPSRSRSNTQRQEGCRERRLLWRRRIRCRSTRPLPPCLLYRLSRLPWPPSSCTSLRCPPPSSLRGCRSVVISSSPPLPPSYPLLHPPTRRGVPALRPIPMLAL